MAFWDLKVRRRPPVHRPATGTCRCGAAETDITPPLGLAMAGHSLLGRHGDGFRGRLFARTLYLEDPRGRAVALCVADMHSATRYVFEKAASITSREAGLSVDRLVLAGTHTHNAPGNMYGSSLFDTLAQRTSGFSKEYADWLADRIAASVKEAQAFSVEARLGIRRIGIWGASRNRSLGAFERTPEAERWHLEGWPGKGQPDPAGRPPIDRARSAVDPRITTLVGVSEETGLPLAAFGIFGCHATALGDGVARYAPDWPGWAVREAWRRIHESARAMPILGLAQGAAGDVDPDVDWIASDPFERTRRIGELVGSRWSMAIELAAKEASPFELHVRFDDAPVSDPTLGPSAELDPEWQVGVPALAGGGVNRSGWLELLAREGQRRRGPVRPGSLQDPKVPAAGLLQDTIRRAADLDPGPTLPHHLVTIRRETGEHWIATVCGEPTVAVAHRIERALRGDPPIRDVTVLGLAGDYHGYFTTAEEYAEQHYEGAQTLHGRNSGRNLVERLRRLAADEATPVDLEGEITFRVVERVPGFSIRAPQRSVRVTGLEAHRHAGDPRHVIVSWKVRGSVDVPFHSGPFVTLFQRTEHGWDVVQRGARPFDDRYQEVVVERHPSGILGRLRRRTWRVELWAPEDIPANRPLRIKIHPRGGFKGFDVEV